MLQRTGLENWIVASHTFLPILTVRSENSVGLQTSNVSLPFPRFYDLTGLYARLVQNY